MTFWPPAWHAAQLPEKTCSPAPTSPANADIGLAARTAAAVKAGAAALNTSTAWSLVVCGALNERVAAAPRLNMTPRVEPVNE